jgi:hypothetical protein
LAKAGYKVEQLIESTSAKQAGKKNPDFRIEGQIFDNYAPTTSNPRNIADTLKTKIQKGQADRFVLNLDDSSVSPEVMRVQLEQWPISGLQEIIIVKNGYVLPFFPFSK